jgi:hypothetical protein
MRSGREDLELDIDCVPKSLQLWERIPIRDKSRKGFLSHSPHSEIADMVAHNPCASAMLSLWFGQLHPEPGRRPGGSWLRCVEPQFPAPP